MSEYHEGRTTIVVLDPDTPPANSPLRRALRDFHGELVTIRTNTAQANPKSPVSR